MYESKILFPEPNHHLISINFQVHIIVDFQKYQSVLLTIYNIYYKSKLPYRYRQIIKQTWVAKRIPRKKKKSNWASKLNNWRWWSPETCSFRVYGDSDLPYIDLFLSCNCLITFPVHSPIILTSIASTTGKMPRR